MAQDAHKDDPVALAARADAAVGMGRADEAVRLGEQCVTAHPEQSVCHLALGNALGAVARNASPMAAMRFAGRIRDSFIKAVQLDPRNTDARFALLDYYIHAPAIAGGGKGKARALAAQTAAVNPAAARLMQAQLDLAADNLARAEATLLSVQPGDDAMVADRQRDLFSELAQRYQADNRSADSERVAAIAHKRFPR